MRSMRLYYGSKTKHKHEIEQLKEIVEIVSKSSSQEEIVLLSNVLLANNEIDCIILTKNGPIIIELKAYKGEIIGQENGDWYVRTEEEEIPLKTNLYQQLRSQRNDLFNKLDKVRENNFPRIESEDFRKINAWGYFKSGSKYSDNQINLNIARWFDVVTAETLINKINQQNSGYTLFYEDMEIIIKELHLIPWPDDMISNINESNTAQKQNSITNHPVDDDFQIKTQYPKEKIMDIIERMASNGLAPEDGCSLFDIGNDVYISSLKSLYFQKNFKRGISAEKFVVGPFGSGKSHFVRLLCEHARKMDCVTATVPLTKQIDVTNSNAIYKEISREIKTPSGERGIKKLLIAIIEKIQKNSSIEYSDNNVAEKFVRKWVESLENYDFESDLFSRVIRQAFDAYLKEDLDRFDSASRWIGGEFDNRSISRDLNISPITKSELTRTASRVNLSLYQLIKLSGFLGTVVVFDEAEQGFEISNKKKSVLYSLMQSDINALNDLKDGSALILYAILPSIKEGMMNFPALQQRVQHPVPFERNPRAPLIEISYKHDSSKEGIVNELVSIGNRLIKMYYYVNDEEFTFPEQDVYDAIKNLAKRTYEEDTSISSRRMMVKGTCSLLMHLHDTGVLLDPMDISLSTPSIGVDDEV